MIPEHELLNASILIVDDQAAHVQLLERVLGEAGYANVASTTNPREVRALHAAKRFDLILLDLQMAGMDGFAVMDELKTIGADSYLPVIVITAQPAHKLRALQAGAKDFINKPYDLLEVKTRIHNMLEVRLLHRRLVDHNRLLEQTVLERTAELRESEARFRRLTELASDWYWEQNENGDLTRVSGPVEEMLGMGFTAFLGGPSAGVVNGDPIGTTHGEAIGWIEAEREALHAKIVARQPFLDFAFTRIAADGSQRHFRVSGEPMFDPHCRYTGYRGIGVEVLARK